MRKTLATLTVLLAFAISAAAFAQGPAYIVNADVVRGAKNPVGPTCVLTPVFKTGEQVVWRAVVYDAATGEKLTPEEVVARGIKVTATLEDGTSFDMEYGLHPKDPPQIYLFVGAWVIPPVYPTGTLQYTITVTDDAGNSVVWEPIGQDREGGYSSLMTIEKR
ncbi:MAG: hypothetical protein WC972_11240 [Trueperaceae bacterium]